jgi:uncharacterized protein (TIGR00730 family)
MNRKLRSICVFAGSRAGSDPLLVQLASDLGTELARRGIQLVYGGGRVGLMGAAADAALAAGGKVIGVIPKTMVEREWAHNEVTELVLTDGMHERKAVMAARSDAFLVLPGGIGTLEELFEVTSWAYLRFHHKPIALLDPTDYYAPLITMLHSMVDAGFIDRDTLHLLLRTADMATALDRLAEAMP